MSEVVIKAEGLSKYYKLGVINNGTLFRDMQSYFARKFGKEDPHAKIGAKYDPTAEGFWALKDLNFEINKGDRVGIIGANGAGKSTLLKILSRITAPTEGRVKTIGRIASLLEVGSGFHGELTGRENIYLNGAVLGMKKHEIDRKIEEIIDFSGIEQHIDTPVKRYSSGMYVRLGFAVAAHLDSEILIADEVLAVGDAAFQQKALGKMNELSAGQGRTVLFVSHNMTQVKSLCNKGIVLEKGRVVRQDDDISNSISHYLGICGADGQKNINKSVPWHNDGRFTDELFTPQKIEFLDKKGNVTTDAFDYDKGGTVRLSFSVKKKTVEPVSVAIHLFYKTEEIERVNMGLPLQAFEPGNYDVCFKIPEKKLIPGTYVLSLSACIVNRRFIVNWSNFDVTAIMRISSETVNLENSVVRSEIV